MFVSFNQRAKKYLQLLNQRVCLEPDLYCLKFLLENTGTYYLNLYNDFQVARNEIQDFEDLYMLSLQAFFGFYTISHFLIRTFFKPRNIFCDILIECSFFDQLPQFLLLFQPRWKNHSFLVDGFNLLSDSSWIYRLSKVSLVRYFALHL